MGGGGWRHYSRKPLPLWSMDDRWQSGLTCIPHRASGAWPVGSRTTQKPLTSPSDDNTMIVKCIPCYKRYPRAR
jgi:hypothetical protein